MLLQLRVRAASLHHHLALSQHLDPRPAGAADGARPGRAPATSGRAYCSSAAAAARGIAADAAGGGAMCATPEKMAAARAAAAGRPAVVCYHHPCNDGVYAALAAHAHFARGGGSNSNARFWPLNVFKPPVISEMGLRGDEVVYMLDYTGPKGFARELAGHCARLIVLDHHKTAAEELGVPAAALGAPEPQPAAGEPPVPPPPAAPLPANMDVLLDMGRSGAVLALDYFGREGLPESALRAFGYVQDADLWAWKLPGSREFHAGLSQLGLEYSALANPGIFEQLLRIDVDDIIRRGAGVLAEQQRQIAAAVESASTLRLGGELGSQRAWGQALGCVVSGALVGWRSALGNALAERSAQMGLEPVGVVAYVEDGMEPGLIKVSLRSVNNWDTTRVTQAFGGGGHRAASSCITPEDDFEAWKQG